MRSPAKRLNFLATVFVLAAGACGSDGTGAKQPSAIAPLGGNAQQAAVGEELANPLLVKVTDASGNALRGVTVTWTVESGGGSANPATSTTDGEGLATTRWRVGSTPGEQAITAAVAGVSAARFTATATPGTATALTVAPDSAVLSALGDTIRFTANLADRFGNPLRGLVPQWTSLDTAILEVSASGTVRARANGRGRVVAALEGRSDTVAVRVRQVAAAVTVSPAADTLLVGASMRLTAAARDANGFPIADARPTWSSSDPSVATVDSTGTVQARARGGSSVSVTVDNIVARAAIQVVQGLGGPLTAGYSHTCAILAGGEAYCWGVNSSGELGAPSSDCGVGSDACSTTPIAVSGGLRFRAISNGQGWSCAITQSGEPYCWGRNTYGNLGNGTRTASAVPVRVSGGLTFASIAVGGSQSCGLTAGGQAYCWGNNGAGGVGDGTTADRLTPVRVNTTRTFRSLTAGNGHTCGIATTDELLCWGWNAYAQLGDGTVVNRLTPGVVGAGIAFTSVSAGYAHTCGGTAEGEVYCWGDNTFGQLGTQATMETCSGFYGTVRCRKTPTRVAGATSFSQVTAGMRHSCAIGAGAAAYCWGDNSRGALGAASDDACSYAGSSLPCSLVPVRVGGGHSYAVLSAGQLYTCGGTSEGTVLCWGWNNGGQLGNGTRTDRGSPTRVALP